MLQVSTFPLLLAENVTFLTAIHLGIYDAIKQTLEY